MISPSEVNASMQLRTRIQEGGTPRHPRWGIDSEYGRLRDVLIGPIDNFAWQAGNAVARRTERAGLRFDPVVARTQYEEMICAYASAGVNVQTGVVTWPLTTIPGAQSSCSCRSPTVAASMLRVCFSSSRRESRSTIS